jgi:hypothetical protein
VLYALQSHEVSSVIHCAPPLGSWLLTPLPLSEFGNLHHSHFLRLAHHAVLPLTVVNYVHCLWASVLFGGGSLPMNCTELCSLEDLCSPVAPATLLFTPAKFDPGKWGEMASSFSQAEACRGYAGCWSHAWSRLVGCM